MKKTLVKYLIRLLIALCIAVIALVILVTQPVIADKDYQKPLADVNTLKSTVVYLSDTLHKNTSVAELLDGKAEYLYNQSKALHDNVSYQSYDVQGVEYKNVQVLFKGTKPCGTYVVGAHFDTEENFPGADDNSSGSAGLLELVRLFSQNPPKCDVQLVFYNLEEPPYFRSQYMGSSIHAKSLKDNNVNVEMMLSLEMIGYFSDEVGSQAYPLPAMQHLYSDKGDFISIVGNMAQTGITRFLKKAMRESTPLPVYSINAPAFVVGIDFSDHLNYWASGYKAVMITDTAFNRNENYHTENDTAEKLDYKRMAQVVDGVYYALVEHMD